MRIAITAAGSRGDLEPCVALGRGLRAAGHRVVVATWPNFGDMVRGAGLDFRAVAGPDPNELMGALLESGRDPRRFARAFGPVLGATLKLGYEDWRAACLDAEAVVYSPLGFLGYAIAGELGIPRIGVGVEPLFCRNGLFPSCALGRPPAGTLLTGAPGVGGLYNRLSYLMVERSYWRVMKPLVDDLQTELGRRLLPDGNPLARIEREREPTLYGWSPSVLPQPPEWEGRLHATGYWFSEHDNWEPPRELTEFLGSGPPPVAMGLGSTTELDTQALDAAAGAIQAAGSRGVIVAAGAGRRTARHEAHPDVLVVGGFVPYRWLFERSAAVVHHGGAGTTAAALWAGRPSVVVPSLPDQAFWGWRLSALGVSPEPIPRERLSHERLAAAIRTAVTDAEMGERAGRLGQRIRAEDGVGTAVEWFHRHVSRGPAVAAKPGGGGAR